MRFASLIAVLLCSLTVHGIDSLKALTNWEKIAPGIWKTGIANAEEELTYTSLAVRPPKIAALNLLPEVGFPFDEKQIEFDVSDEGLIQVRIPADPAEAIYGFGLQLDGIKKSKVVLDLNVDHWAKGGGRTHAPVPFYISSRGYGVLFNTARFLKVYVQVHNRRDSPNNPLPVDRNPPPEEPAPRRWSAQPGGDAVEAYLRAKGLEILVFSGKDMQDIVARYNLYCGGGALPPLWGLGFWHRVPADYTADQTRQEVRDFNTHDIPLDVIGLEPGWMTRSYPCTYEWQPHRFPDPTGFTQELLSQGIRLNLWINPYVSPEGKLYEKLYPYSGSHLVWLGLVPDYTLSEPGKILSRQFKEDHLDLGISGYKIDEVDGYDRWLWPEHASFPSGTTAETMRQAYGMIMQKLLYQELFHSSNIRTWSNVRSSNAGASGYPFVIYSDSYQHSQYITGISAASLGGILWTPEVRQASDADEWLARIQTVCFSPMAKLNAWASGTKPWQYESVTGDVRDVIRLRLRLLPYLYTAFANYNRHGVPPMRAMILERESGQGDEAVVHGMLDGVGNPYAESLDVEKNDQFMFGPSILVAPYYENHSASRKVTLPRGNWYDFHTGQFVGNGTVIEVNTPDRIPLFVKEGAVIPMLSGDIDNTEQAYGHSLEVRHYGNLPGTFELYEDDGISFNYESGQYSLRRLSMKKGEVKEETIRPGPGMFGSVIQWVEMTQP